MKKIFAILFVIVLQAGHCLAQEDTAKLSDPIFDTYPGFFLDKGEPLFTLPDAPSCFEFLMFDRWGNLVARSIDYTFIIDDAFIDRSPLPEAGAYFHYLLEYTSASGEEKRFIGTLICYGYHCSG